MMDVIEDGRKRKDVGREMKESEREDEGGRRERKEYK